MSMPYVLFNVSSLFTNGNREDSENTILWLLEILTERNQQFLIQNPNTPKLYDSGVVYAVPEQMAECRVDVSKLNELSRYLKKIGAGDDTIEIILAFLRGIEVFRDIPAILKKKAVDCDNLASWRAAELRVVGIKASPYITWRERWNGTTYHALVRWPDGTSEDPSLLLGMGGEARAADRAEEVRKNKERFDNYVETAKQLCAQGTMNVSTAGKTIDALGLLPRTRSW